MKPKNVPSLVFLFVLAVICITMAVANITADQASLVGSGPTPPDDAPKLGCDGCPTFASGPVGGDTSNTPRPLLR